LRFRAPIPIVILGVPIPGSENPLLVSPIASITVDIDIWECRNPSANIVGLKDLESALVDFWFKLTRGLGLKLCSTLSLYNVEGVMRPPLGGLYASLTSLTLYAVHRFHGDLAQALDIVETASLIDLVDVDVSWRLVLEALRYSTLRGKPLAYRGPLEAYVFENTEPARVNVGAHVEGVKSVLSRDSLGYNVYGALIHLMGEAVLEASARIRDGLKFKDVITIFKPIHDGVTLTVYNLKPSSDNCLWSPGTPWAFDEVCLVV
jgi:hypothetical protein